MAGRRASRSGTPPAPGPKATGSLRPAEQNSPRPTTNSTGGHAVVANSFWNFLGQVVPLGLAFVAIPILVNRMGLDRFGVLTLVWLVIGYFGLLDMGLGRALTKTVAELLARQHPHEAVATAWTGLTLLFLLGVVGAAAVMLVAPVFAGHIVRGHTLQIEAQTSLYILAATLPFVTLSSGLRGVLEAHQRFDLSALVRIVLGAFNYLGPLAALPLSVTLPPSVSILAIGRLVTCGLLVVACTAVMTGFVRPTLDWRRAAPLARYGGWVTVSNVIGPVILYLDRILVAVLLTASAVGYYATPYEVAIRLLLVSTAIATAAFPAFASISALDPRRASALFMRSLTYLFLFTFPICFGFVYLGREGLVLWLGSQFAAHSAVVLQIIAIGVLMNALAQMPFALLQARGRPDLTAKLHLVELIVYAPFAWWLIGAHGLAGAAIAWSARATFDFVTLLVLSIPYLHGARRLLASVCVWAAALAIMIVGVALPLDLPLAVLFYVIAVALLSSAVWRYVVDSDDKAWFTARWKVITGFGAAG